MQWVLPANCALIWRLSEALNAAYLRRRVNDWLGILDTDLVFTHGQPALYLDGGVSRGFCRDCGSSLTYASTRFPDYVQLHLGTLDNPEVVVPEAHVHCAEKVAWFEVADELPHFEGSAAADSDDWQKP
jgi:hypothetical protein